MKRYVKKGLFQKFLRDKSGLAAVEFALLGPMLSFMLLAIVDIGLTIHERMELDQSLRVGADFVMASQMDPEFLEKMIVAAASGELVQSEQTETAGDTNSSPYTAKATRYYFCAEEPAVHVNENHNNCANDLPPAMGFDFELEQIHSAMFFGDIMLKSQLSVQVQ